ncbi:MAG: hypothetical protein COB66_02275 [Coxiella sp. (in: Bacteria)]|nr:MAG: hypothetical protein COB66_02275 [Coxiella sp. (in: g-proteobacteria)]
MKLTKRKMIATIAGVAGLSAMLLAPASQAGWRNGYYRHQWHPAGRSVHYRGCRKIVRQRECRFRHGYRQCFVRHWSRFVC